MLIGHYAPAFLLGRARPSVPLWVFFVAVQLVDVLWGIFILAGVEHARIVPGFSESNALDLYDMPFTHSLVATGAWAVLAGVAWAVLRPSASRIVDGIAVGLAVASHFAADFVVHLQDLPVFRGDGPKLGLGLWRHRELALLVEAGLFVGCGLVWWWPRRGRRGAIFLAALAAFLVLSFYVPTPPSPGLMAATGLFTYAACAWAASRFRRRASPGDDPGTGAKA